MSHLECERFTFNTPRANAWLELKKATFMLHQKQLAAPRMHEPSVGTFVERMCKSAECVCVCVCVLGWRMVKCGCTMWFVAWQHWRDLTSLSKKKKKNSLLVLKLKLILILFSLRRNYRKFQTLQTADLYLINVWLHIVKHSRSHTHMKKINLNAWSVLMKALDPAHTWQ